jgi:hypothetical protein
MSQRRVFNPKKEAAGSCQNVTQQQIQEDKLSHIHSVAINYIPFRDFKLSRLKKSHARKVRTEVARDVYEMQVIMIPTLV